MAVALRMIIQDVVLRMATLIAVVDPQMVTVMMIVDGDLLTETTMIKIR